VTKKYGTGKNHFERLRTLRKIIRDRQPDVVISFLPNVNIAALVATAYSGIPCIVCERSDPTKQPIGRLWSMACKLFYRTADRVTVQSQAVAATISHVYGGLKDVAVVPNPLPQGVLKFKVTPERPGRRVLLSLGRLAAEKQVTQIVDTFARLASRFPEWDLHIHGEGPLHAQLAAGIGALGLGDRIRLMGRTDAPWQTMAAADAFVMASRYEGFPNALLEAMGTGLPCVATDCPSGPREITRDGTDALLVVPDDPAALEVALARLMGDAKLRRDLGERARESVKERYSLPAVLRTWDAIFASVGVPR
jgi:glycosyltransferase involved in cell wall biosynthesis